MNNTTGTIRVTLTYDVPVRLTSDEDRDAWGDVATVAEARERYAAWLADGSIDMMLELGTFESAIVGVEVLDNPEPVGSLTVPLVF